MSVFVKYLDTFSAHQMSVSSIKWNPFHKGNLQYMYSFVTLPVLLDVFLSSSDDWSVKMWSQLSPSSPLFVFDLQAAVGDISWSIFSSTSFGAATSDGKVFVYDLAVNKYAGTRTGAYCRYGCFTSKNRANLTYRLSAV